MRIVNLTLLTIMFSGPVFNQQSGFPGNLVAKGAKPEKTGTGYAFTEGCSVAPDGRVYFTDQPNDRIFIWEEKKGITMYKEGTDRSNGTLFDSRGYLYTCADLNNSLVKFGPEGEKIVVYDKGFNDKHLNGPNDLWIDHQGGIYFTDPYYHRDYWPEGHKQLLEIQAVYYLKPTGELIRVIDDLQQPNGIIGTTDGKILYVADIRANITWRYTINSDGSLSSKTQFAPAGSDGMVLDNQGNVYLTSGKVQIFDFQGKKVGDIELPEKPSNICFGGKKRNILFITARTSVYTLKMKVKGVE
jgi:gluconolactonase